MSLKRWRLGLYYMESYITANNTREVLQTGGLRLDVINWSFSSRANAASRATGKNLRCLSIVLYRADCLYRLHHITSSSSSSSSCDWPHPLHWWRSLQRFVRSTDVSLHVASMTISPSHQWWHLSDVTLSRVVCWIAVIVLSCHSDPPRWQSMYVIHLVLDVSACAALSIRH